ncbi:hypothetical protein QP938_06475 [Porticoccaceae bacterium LTM1]|nr:hypothetical protein QP938_06475 [Porticoccaceae bacterium LTM1]
MSRTAESGYTKAQLLSAEGDPKWVREANYTNSALENLVFDPTLIIS